MEANKTDHSRLAPQLNRKNDMTQQEEHDAAAKHGFSRIRDDKRGYGWFRYTKFIGDKQIMIWRCSKGWARAEIIDNQYCHHIYFDDIEAAFCYFAAPHSLTRDDKDVVTGCLEIQL